jgi:UDP-N-acetylmuramoyl-L-alanyl-D-glutamate--2,6-diaminopimelate ligase
MISGDLTVLLMPVRSFLFMVKLLEMTVKRNESISQRPVLVPLRMILEGIPSGYTPAHVPDISITGIAIDNRKVNPGNLFVALSGAVTDGHSFIHDAIQAGATVVVGEKRMDGLSVPYYQVGNSRQALSWLAAAYYGNPARKLTVIGVTGTDGKTTTCNLIYQILIAAGKRAGLISTVNAVIGEEILDTGFHVTTPDAHNVQRYLAKMVEADLTHVVLETTSHGWAQYRVDACEFDIGVITNITHEHLDQHGSFENYQAAKGRLFSSLHETISKQFGNPRLAVLNKDDQSYGYLSHLATGPQCSYGVDTSADIRAENIRYSPKGLHFDAIGKGFNFPVRSSLIGGFNVSNCLAAISTGIRGLQIDPQSIKKGIEALSGIPGRMEVIDMGQTFTAIVDFAHTPNALRVAIETVRQLAERKVIVIFGSAGLRDREKRRMMAEVASKLADISILTAEDPRTESLEDILGEMALGAESSGGTEGKSFFRVPDRGNAIRMGIRLAAPGDVVMACGKGHEQSLCFGSVEFAWDDRTAMRAALSEFLGIEGPEMPYLPTNEGI